MTSEQYSDDELSDELQNELFVHNFCILVGFCKIWQKYVVIKVKNPEKYGKNTVLTKIRN